MTGKMQIKNRLIMEECFTCVKTTISFDNLNIILHFIPSVIQVQLSSIFFFKNCSFFYNFPYNQCYILCFYSLSTWYNDRSKTTYNF